MHRAALPDCWQGRSDPEEGAGARRWFQKIRLHAGDPAPHGPGLALLGFASDAGVARNQGRIGAAGGPMAIRKALANLVWHPELDGPDFLAPGSVAAHFAAPDFVASDFGDVVCVADALEAAQLNLAAQVQALLNAQWLPLVLGGGHEVAWGSWQGLAAYLAQPGRHLGVEGTPPPRVGILNFDAHFDLRLAPQGTSGTPFRQIAEDCAARAWPFKYACLGVSENVNTSALFERARALGVWWVTDEFMSPSNLPQLRRELQDWLQSVDYLYLTFCLDVLPGSVAPGVSAPAALGVEWRVLSALLEVALASRKLLLADIAEMNPRYDQDARTAKLAARWIDRIARSVAQAHRANSGAQAHRANSGAQA